MTLTADTITDEQIRELRAQVRDARGRLTGSMGDYDRVVDCNATEYQCRVALGERRARRGWSRAKARARCAEILNARAAKESP